MIVKMHFVFTPFIMVDGDVRSIVECCKETGHGSIEYAVRLKIERIFVFVFRESDKGK